mmetsp:Transcript_38837/g.99679  ORF Transcript_38837/g.99679 Transcript_38837/m.99679 type:complete len:829 (-) Transcript_38837:966-3452(-)
MEDEIESWQESYLSHELKRKHGLLTRGEISGLGMMKDAGHKEKLAPLKRTLPFTPLSALVIVVVEATIERPMRPADIVGPLCQAYQLSASGEGLEKLRLTFQAWEDSMHSDPVSRWLSIFLRIDPSFARGKKSKSTRRIVPTENEGIGSALSLYNDRERPLGVQGWLSDFLEDVKDGKLSWQAECGQIRVDSVLDCLTCPTSLLCSPLSPPVELILPRTGYQTPVRQQSRISRSRDREISTPSERSDRIETVSHSTLDDSEEAPSHQEEKEELCSSKWKEMQMPRHERPRLSLLPRGFRWKAERKEAQKQASARTPMDSLGRKFSPFLSIDVVAKEIDIGTALFLMVAKYLAMTSGFLLLPSLFLLLYFSLASTTSSIPWPNFFGSFGHVEVFTNTTGGVLNGTLIFDSFKPFFADGWLNNSFPHQKAVDYPLEAGCASFLISLILSLSAIVFTSKIRRKSMEWEAETITMADFSIVVRGVKRIEPSNSVRATACLRAAALREGQQPVTVLVARQERHMISLVEKMLELSVRQQHMALCLCSELLRREGVANRMKKADILTKKLNHITQKRWQMEKDIKLMKHSVQPLTDYALVTFSTLEAADAVVKRGWIEVEGQRLRAKRASEPRDIRWANLDISKMSKAGRQVLTALISLVLSTLGAAMITLVSVAQANQLIRVGTGTYADRTFGFWSNVLVSLLSIVVSTFANLMVVQLSHLLVVKVEKHHSKDKEDASMMLKVLLFNFLCAALSAFIFLLEARIEGAVPIGNFGGSIVLNATTIDIYYSGGFTRYWYTIGANVVLNILIGLNSEHSKPLPLICLLEQATSWEQ